MLYLCWILFLLKNFLDYEKIDLRLHILKRHKLNLPPKKVAVTFSVPKSIHEWPVRQLTSSIS